VKYLYFLCSGMYFVWVRFKACFGFISLRATLAHVNTSAAKEILEGVYECPEGTDNGTWDLFEEISRMHNVVPKNSVSTTISKERWKQRWRKAKERTSSSESGIHFGYYIAGANSEMVL